MHHHHLNHQSQYQYQYQYAYDQQLPGPPSPQPYCSFFDSSLLLPSPLPIASSPALLSHLHNAISSTSTSSPTSASAGSLFEWTSFSCPDNNHLPAAALSALSTLSPASHSTDTIHNHNSPASSSPAICNDDAVVRVKKRKVSTLTAEQRLLRRRAQHRAVDTSRRQRETNAIDRLRLLLSQQQTPRQLHGRAQDGEADNAALDDGNKAGNGSGRLTVLESSIALIEQLTSACKRMEAAIDTRGGERFRSSNQLHTAAATVARVAAASILPHTGSTVHSSPMIRPTPPTTQPQLPPTSSSSSSLLSLVPRGFVSMLESADRSHSLSLCQSSGLSVLSHMCMFVIAVPCLSPIDVNSAFLSLARAQRSDLQHSSVDGTDAGYCSLLLSYYSEQYPASIAETTAVSCGDKRRGSATWRCRTWDGAVYEANFMFHADYDEMPLSDSERRVPDRLVIMYALDEVVFLDDAHVADSPS